MILVYTGKGKGKTSACVGQAIRALGQGLSVAFGQFIKRDKLAGEQRILRSLLGENFFAQGLGFLRKEEDKPAHRERARELLVWAARRQAAMLVLDEAIYALDYGLIDREDLAPFLNRAKDKKRHLALSGRGTPDWLLECADMVTEMRPVKHHLDVGISALPGIEY